MHGLPVDWWSLCAMALLSGMRHGLDADHLATIDALTRLHPRAGRGTAPWCGTMFSLGHGVVVVGVAVVVGAIGAQWAPPHWLETLGGLVSIGFLLLLGLLNLRAVLRASPGTTVSPVGLRAHWIGRLPRARSPLGAAAVGALFAVSFDTLTQSALFAAASVRYGGGSALVLSALFVAGMLLTDGLNGWWIARLVARSDRLAQIASRVMGTTIAVASLLVAALGLARWHSVRVDALADGRELAIGLMVTGIVAAGYLLAAVAARRARRA